MNFQEVIIDSTDWVNLSALSGVAPGTEVTLVNKGSSSVNVISVAAKPTTNTGLPLKPINGSGATYSVITIGEESTDPVWVKGAAASSLIAILY